MQTPPISQEEIDTNEIDYNSEFEQLLKENGEHSQVYSILHQMSYIKYKYRFDMLNIPSIILTAIIGFMTGIGINYAHTGVILGASSVFVSIMKSITSYMKLNERSENHRICSLQFAQISNEIKIELSLRRKQRQPAKILLDVIKVKFKNLMEVAHLIDNDIIQQFRDKYLMDKEYNESNVSLPPVFSKIPGIKIMGADNEQEHAMQLHAHLERYVAERKFERDQVMYELQHIAELRTIKEKYRVPERKSHYDVDDSHSDSSANQRQSRRTRLARQRSMGSDYSSIVVKSPQAEEPVNTVVIIPPAVQQADEHVTTVVTVPPQIPSQSQQESQEEQEPSQPHHEFPSLDEVD
jgi:hypothetical protein